jgi:hypothetical protein
MKTLLIVTATCAGLALAGCTTTEGALVGGVSGAAIGGIASGTAGGALVGAGVGALAGAVLVSHANGRCVYRAPNGQYYRTTCY